MVVNLNHIHHWLTNSSCSHLIISFIIMRSWQPLTNRSPQGKHILEWNKRGGFIHCSFVWFEKSCAELMYWNHGTHNNYEKFCSLHYQCTIYNQISWSNCLSYLVPKQTQQCCYLCDRFIWKWNWIMKSSWYPWKIIDSKD